MATKLKDTCLEKSADDEPIFVLVARDRLAPAIVQAWINAARDTGVPEEKLTDAEDLIGKMVAWQIQHGSKTPD